MSLAEVGIVYGTAPWVWITMLPGAEAGTVPGRVSLVPLRDLLTILASGPLTATTQVGGNLLVFAALGFFAPLRCAAATGRVGRGPAVIEVRGRLSALLEQLATDSPNSGASPRHDRRRDR